MSLVVFIVFMVFMAKPLAQFVNSFQENSESEKRERELEMIRKAFMIEKERRIRADEWETVSRRAIRLSAHSLRDL